MPDAFEGVKILDLSNSLAHGIPLHGSLANIRRPTPLHGQHTEEILRELGYGHDNIQHLQDSGTVQQ